MTRSLKSLVLVITMARVAPGQQATDELDMSVKELMRCEVSSVARKQQAIARAPAAVYVIGRDDIRRSGYRTVPELLRLAPGLYVAQVGAHTWAISARGFNGVYANKMLVLIDGRSVYTPYFAGVYWELHDLMVEDIEGIEVIRGPGATMWGANAVNGVINVITRSARATQGGLISAGTGAREAGFGSLRYGGRFAGNAWYRVYAKSAEYRSAVTAEHEDAGDSWRDGRGGMRLDWEPSVRDAVTVIANASRARFHEAALLPSAGAPYMDKRAFRFDTAAENVLARWRRTHRSGGESQLQFYYNAYDRPHPVYGERRQTVDAEFQNRLPAGGAHELTWGGGYRFSADGTTSSHIQVSPASFGLDLLTAFAQDEIQLIEDTAILTAGVKLQHNDYTGIAVQPTIRFLIEPAVRHVFWTSVSRAVRMPSRLDRDSDTWYATMPGSPQTQWLPQRVFIRGSTENGAQPMIAYEAGYRSQPLRRLALDMTVFRNTYQRLRSMRPGQPAPVPGPSPYLAIPFIFDSGLAGTSWGGEAMARIEISRRWNVTAAYTGIDSRLWVRRGVVSAVTAESALQPPHIASLRSQLDLPGGLQFDASWYSTAAMRRASDIASPFSLNLPGGWAKFDLRLMWPIRRNLELTVRADNVLDPHHQEFQPEAFLQASQCRRGVGVTLEWRF